MLYTLKNDFLEVKVDSFGAELRSVKSKNGEEYIWQGDNEWADHSPVLFPTCGNCPNLKYIWQGKEYKLPIHGIAMYRELTLTDKTDNSLLFTLLSDEETKKSYPFDFKFEVEFKLTENKLSVTLRPTNTGEGYMPFMAGWHPGFNLWGDGEIGSFAVDFGEGDELMWYPILPDQPISYTPLPHALDDGKYYLNEKEIYDNDTMIFENYPRTFKLVDGTGNAKISMSVSENLPFFCIWKAPVSTSRFICLEPWSNIFNSDGTTEDFAIKKMQRLDSGKTCEYTYEVSFT